jgi:hypothetical protein
MYLDLNAKPFNDFITSCTGIIKTEVFVIWKCVRSYLKQIEEGGGGVIFIPH